MASVAGSTATTSNPPKPSTTGDNESVRTNTTTTKKKSTKQTKRRKKNAAAGGAAAGGGRDRVVATSTILAAAATARTELTEMKHEEEARRNDLAWLSGDSIATPAPTSSSTPQNEELRIVEASLRTNGLRRTDLTVSGLAALTEEARRYASDIVADAQDYAWHCNRRDVTPADFKMAAGMRGSGSADSSLPSADHLANISNQMNALPLPPIPSNCYRGVLLPPPQQQLTQPTFDVLIPPQQTPANAPTPLNKTSDSKNTPSYGANKGTQIPIHLKPKETPQPRLDPPSTQPITTNT